MSGKSPAFDPSEHFVLCDIALWETSFKRHEEYQSGIHEGHISIQTMRSFEAEEYSVELEGMDGSHDMLRALIRLGVRSAYRPGEEDEAFLYTLEATFAVEYVISERPSDEQIREFVEFNCVHNVWPFWRQHVYDTIKRASLPVPVVPFFSGRPAQRPKKLRRAPAQRPTLEQGGTKAGSNRD